MKTKLYGRASIEFEDGFKLFMFNVDQKGRRILSDDEARKRAEDVITMINTHEDLTAYIEESLKRIKSTTNFDNYPALKKAADKLENLLIRSKINKKEG